MYCNKIYLVLLISISAICGCNNTGNNDLTDHTPICDLKSDTFQNYTGGKYPDGSNMIPSDHYLFGTELAKSVNPLDITGNPDDTSGKIGLLILGYSTAAMTGKVFNWLTQFYHVNTQLKISIGAQGGKDINAMMDGHNAYWLTVTQNLFQDSLSPLQVQYIWISTGDIFANERNFPDQSIVFADKLFRVLQIIKQQYPNIKMVFISDRQYAGYIDSDGPQEFKEPTGYYSSWGVKFIIERQIKKQPGYQYSEIPFIDWGPTLWTNGSAGNHNGYKWLWDDVEKGGIHPSAKGRAKEAMRLFIFFANHPYTQDVFTFQRSQQN